MWQILRYRGLARCESDYHVVSYDLYPYALLVIARDFSVCEQLAGWPAFTARLFCGLVFFFLLFHKLIF